MEKIALFLSILKTVRNFAKEYTVPGKRTPKKGYTRQHIYKLAKKEDCDFEMITIDKLTFCYYKKDLEELLNVPKIDPVEIREAELPINKVNKTQDDSLENKRKRKIRKLMDDD